MTRVRAWPPPPPRGGGAEAPSSGGGVVLGIDPGSRATGWAVVALTPHDSMPRLAGFGVIRTKEKDPQAQRLHEIFESLGEIIARHRPEEAAVENVFHAANARSALVLGQARGAALAAAASRGLAVHEYMPLTVKKTVTGYGRAEKGQVQRMAALLVRGGEAIRDSEAGLDASDALAVALCHLAQRRGAALARQAPVPRRKAGGAK